MLCRVWLPGFGLECFQQTVGKTGSIKNGAQQQKTAAGIFLPRRLQENLAYFGIAGESFRSLEQPYIELAFDSAQVGSKFGVIIRWIVHQKSGMHFEKLREQPASRLGQMRTRSAL